MGFFKKGKHYVLNKKDNQLPPLDKKQIDLDSNGQSLLINSNRKHRLITEEYFIGLSVWKYKKHDQLGENSLEEISFFSE